MSIKTKQTSSRKRNKQATADKKLLAMKHRPLGSIDLSGCEKEEEEEERHTTLTIN